MRKGALVMANPPGMSLALDLSFPSQIKLFLLQQCTLPAENLQTRALFPQYLSEIYLRLNRMVRVGSFTTLTKLGSGTEESFTSLLISRVCLLKTLKTFKLQSSKMQMRKCHE
jgi:hypothetical protein